MKGSGLKTPNLSLLLNGIYLNIHSTWPLIKAWSTISLTSGSSPAGGDHLSGMSDRCFDLYLHHLLRRPSPAGGLGHAVLSPALLSSVVQFTLCWDGLFHPQTNGTGFDPQCPQPTT
ncbi:unnamed protein product [Boreogadus saida]